MAAPRPYGRYILEDRLAMGGMAEIFRARTAQAGFEKRVCIKRVLPHFLEEEDFVTMFRDEAKTAARLQHANVVQVFDFGEVEDESGTTLFLAMELIEGADLRRLADQSRKKKIPFSIGEVTQIGIEMCRGLHHAHTLKDESGQLLGIVHRDVSPHNVLISKQGEVKITDFGIAKAAERATHTSTGIVKGKVSYMSPEQAEGKPFDHRLDQWAVGVVLWELLCGERLFRGDNDATILRKVLNVEVPAPVEVRGDVPPELGAIIMKALAGEPVDRFADLREMELALSRFMFAGAIDPASADVAAAYARIMDGVQSQAPRRTAILDAPAISSPPPSQSSPAAPSPSQSSPAAPAPSGSSPRAPSSSPPATASGGGALSTEELPALGSAMSSGEVSQVFVSSSRNPASPPEPSRPLPQSVQTQLVDDPAELQAAVAAFEGQRSSASRRNLASVNESSQRSRPSPAAETQFGEGALVAAARAVEDIDDGTPATRTLVPVEQRSAPLVAAPSSSPPAPVAQPPSKAPKLIAAAIVALGAIGGIAIAVSGGGKSTSTSAAPLPPIAAAVPATSPTPPAAPPTPTPPTAAPATPAPATATAPVDGDAADDVARPPAPDTAPDAVPAPAPLPTPLPTPVPAPGPAPVRAVTPKPTTEKPAEAKGAPGSVYVDVIGGWGLVSIGKKSYGETPVKLTLVPGRYVITLESGDGKKKKNVPVVVTAAGKLQVREKL